MWKSTYYSSDVLFLFIEKIFNSCSFSIFFFNECTGLFYDFFWGLWVDRISSLHYLISLLSSNFP